MKKKDLPVLVLLAVLFFSCAPEKVTNGKKPDENLFTSITGKVIDRNGYPVEGAVVSIDADSATPGVSAKNGEFKIGKVEPGKHKINIHHTDYMDTSETIVEVTADQDYVLESEIKLAWDYFIIKGRVKKPSGEALVGVGIAVPRTSITDSTREGGWFVLGKVPRKNTEIKILAASSNIGFKSIDLTLDAEKYDTTLLEQDIVLESGSIFVKGTVFDPEGTPKSGVVVQAVGPGLKDTTDFNGRYQLQNFPSEEEGVFITVSELKNEGLTGSVMGINAINGAFISSVDIHLRNVPQKENGMLLNVADQIINNTDTEVILQVFPISDPMVTIKEFNWKTENAYLKTTDDPELRISMKELRARVLPNWAVDEVDTVTAGVFVEAFSESGEKAVGEFRIQIRGEGPSLKHVGARVANDSIPSDTVTIAVDEWVNFSASPFDPFGGLDFIQWDFGDGTEKITITQETTQRPDVEHFYEEDGVYRTVIRVRDMDGNEVFDTIVVNVEKSDLDAPVLEKPFNGFMTSEDEEEVVLKWLSVAGDSIKYNVLFDYRNKPPARVVAKELVDKTEYTVVVDSGRTYYWQVQAVQGVRRRISRQMWMIRGKSNIEYENFLLSPKPGTRLTGWDVRLEWEKQENAQYKILIGHTPSAISVEKDFSDDFPFATTGDNAVYTLKNGLVGNRTYLWQVISRQLQTKLLQYSPVWHFKTPNHAPSAVILESPDSLSPVFKTGSPVVFNWSRAHDADNDRITLLLFVDTLSPPSLLRAKTRDTTAYVDTAGFMVSGKYFWRVAATDGRDTAYSDSSYLTIRYFIVNQPPEFITELKDLKDTLRAGKLYTDTVKAVDKDKEGKVRYLLKIIPDNWSWTDSIGELGIFTWTPNFSGDTVIHFIVNDAKNLTGTLVWKVTVLDPEKNILLEPPQDTVFEARGNNLFTFKWAVTHDFAYQMLFGSDTAILDSSGNFRRSSSSSTNTLSHTSVLKAHGDYFWKVKIKDKTGKITETPFRKFTVKKPVTDILISPLYDTVMAPRSNNNFRFIWNYVSGFEYQFRFGGDSADVVSITPFKVFPTTAKKYYFDHIIPGHKKYFWQIRVKDTQDNIFNSPVWPLTVEKPDSDILIQPFNDATIPGGGHEFRWKYLSGFKYVLLAKAGDSANMDTLTGSQENSGPDTMSSHNKIKGNRTYYWRVLIKDSVGVAAMSPVWKFSTLNQAPSPPPSFIKPGNNTVVPTNQSISMTWRASTDPDDDSIKYLIYMDDANPPTTLRVSVKDTNAYQFPAINSAGTFFWQVRATDGTTDTVKGDVGRFLTNTAPIFITKANELTNSVKARHLYTVTVSGKDPDGTTGYYSVLKGPPGLKIHKTDGVINWIPSIGLDTDSTYSVFIGLRDGYEWYDTLAFGITVKEVSGTWMDQIKTNEPADYNRLQFKNDTGYLACRSNSRAYVFMNIGTDDNWLPMGENLVSDVDVEIVSMTLRGDMPYILYVESSGEWMNVKRYNGSRWVAVGSEDFAQSNNDGGSCDIELDGDSVYISFRATNKNGLVMKYSGSTWDTLSGGAFADSVEYPDLLINKNLVTIGFRNCGSNNKLNVKAHLNSAWENFGISLPDVAVEYVHLTANQHEHIYVAYKNASTKRVSVIKNNGTIGGAWSYVGGADFSTDIDALYAIQVDNSNNVYVLVREDDGVGPAFYYPSVYFFNGSRWAYLGYPWFWSNPSHTTVSHMDMALKNNVLWVVFRDETSPEKQLSIMKYSSN